MKTAVIVPPIEDFYFTNHRFAVMGAQRAAEIIEKEAGVSTQLINFPVMEKKQIKIPAYLKHLKPHIIEGETGSCSFFTTFRRYGPDTEECCRIILKEKPAAVFFSLFAYCYAEPAVELAALLKKAMPGLPLIAGGAGVSVYPEYFNPFFDAVLPGEGEIILKEYINRMKENSRKDSEFYSPNSRNSNTPASKNIIDLCRHTEEGDFSLSVNTAHSDRYSVNISALLSRGCNKRCRFCSNFITHGRNFRKTPIHLIKHELEIKEELFERHKEKKYFINFEDDNLLTDKDYFLEVINIFTDFFEQYTSRDKILFSAENGLDYNLLTEDLCGKLIDRNFRQFNFTLGSVSSSVISKEKRSGSSRHLSKLLKYINSRSVPAVSYFIAGLKNDTAEKVIESLLFIAENPGISGISMFYSVPGLPDFCGEDYFRNIPPGLLRGSSAYPWNRSLTTDELITAFRISRTVNLFKKEKPDQTDMKLIKIIKEKKKLYTVVKSSGKRELTRPPLIDEEMERLFFKGYYPDK